MAALTRSGARKASEIVMLIFRAVQRKIGDWLEPIDQSDLGGYAKLNAACSMSAYPASIAAVSRPGGPAGLSVSGRGNSVARSSSLLSSARLLRRAGGLLN